MALAAMPTHSADDSALTLSLDIGTSSTRALLWDIQGREVEGVRAQTQYHMHTTPDGGVEMPADEFVQVVVDCIDQAIQQAGDRARRIRAVGVSTYWHSLLALDDKGAPITPIYSWADTRACDAARKLRRDWNEPAVHSRTGCMIHPSYYPAKLTWLRDSNPELYKRAARWASPSEYLLGILFGPDERRVSVSMASATGLFNQDRCEWDTETLAALDLEPGRLAPIVDLRHPARGLQDTYASRWPDLKEAPFFPAVGDGACGNVGSGCVSRDRMAINLGTSGAIRVVWKQDSAAEESGSGPTGAPATAAASPEPIELPSGLWRYRVDRSMQIIGAAFSDGGNVFAWMNSTLKLPAPEELENELAARQPGTHGLTFLPFLAGERSLGWNPDARASLVGMNLNTSPVDIVCASLEAVALRFALAADLLHVQFPTANEIVASGGALPHSPAWTQMFADAIGKPVTVAEEPEASSRGAAMLAMEAAGIVPDVENVPAHLAHTFTPSPDRHRRYRDMLAHQQDLYAKLVTR